jgi:uncharacterized protein (DUF433 family)
LDIQAALAYAAELARDHAEILKAYPYPKEEDIRQSLAYAAWRVEEIEVPISAA